MISLKKKLISGGMWVVAGKFITLFLGLVINGMLARLLAPEEMGAYFLILSIVSIASLMAQFGMAQSIVRIIAESVSAEELSRARRAVKLSLRMVIIGAFVIAALLYFLLGLWVANYIFDSVLIASVIGLIAIMTVVMTCQTFLVECFRGLHDVRMATVLGGAITSLIFSALLVVLWVVKGSANLELVIILSIVANGVNLFVVSVMLWARLGSFRNGTSNLRYSEIALIAFPIWISNLSIAVLTQADLWIIGIFLAEDDVAVYGAAARLMAMVMIPMGLVNAVIPSYMAELHSKGKLRQLEYMIRTATTLAFIPSVIITVAFVAFGESILALVYGEYYRESFAVLLILCFGRLVVAWAASAGLVLIMTGYQKAYMTITLLSGVATVGLMVLFLELYGLLGVAIASAISAALRNIILLGTAYYRTTIMTTVDIKLIPRLGGIIRGENKEVDGGTSL